MSKMDRTLSIAGRITIATLAAVYTLFSIGVIKATHYCMGREASVSYFTSESRKCACSLFSAEKESCCEDEHEVVRIEDDHTFFLGFEFSIPELPELDDLYTRQFLAVFVSNKVGFPDTSDAPPPKIPLYTFHCSLVFYDDEVTA